MPQTVSDRPLKISSLVLVPAVITLAITLLRLGGELAHWSPVFFSRAAGGGLAVAGISWLPIIFGPYFAVKLARAGYEHHGLGKTFALALLGLVTVAAGLLVGFAPMLRFPGRELLGLLLVALGPTLVILGWPALFKVLVAYGYAARIPVLIVMFFAIRGHWGTHYDALPATYAGPTSFFAKFLVTAVVPQMIMWIAFTVLVGAIAGSLVAGLVLHKKPTPAVT